MAGKIVADTLEHSTSGSVDTKYVVEGSAKMWVSFSTASGTPSAYDSLNVASFTDVAAGRTTITLTNSMNNNNWAGFGHSSGNTNADSSGQIAESEAVFHDRTTSDGELDVWKPTANAMTDATLNDASIHGDLA